MLTESRTRQALVDETRTAHQMIHVSLIPIVFIIFVNQTYLKGPHQFFEAKLYYAAFQMSKQSQCTSKVRQGCDIGYSDITESQINLLQDQGIASTRIWCDDALPDRREKKSQNPPTSHHLLASEQSRSFPGFITKFQA